MFARSSVIESRLRISSLFTKRQNCGLVQIESICREQINVTEKLIFVLERVENIVRKGENAGNQHFLLFPQCFPKCFSIRPLKVAIVWEWVDKSFNSMAALVQNVSANLIKDQSADCTFYPVRSLSTPNQLHG